MPKTSTERSRACCERKCVEAPLVVKQPPKSGAQRTREYRAKKKALNALKPQDPLAIKRLPKSAAQRNREYRAKKKALKALKLYAQESLAIKQPPKSGAQQNREHRARKNPLKIKQPPKTNAERNREYRARKKALKAIVTDNSAISRVLPVKILKDIMVSCAQRSCTSRDGVDKKESSGITFHRFPKDPARRKIWVQFINRGAWEPTKYSVLCSKHFSESYFDRSSKCYIRLKCNAVPTLGPTQPQILRPKPLPLPNTDGTAKQSFPKNIPEETIVPDLYTFCKIEKSEDDFQESEEISVEPTIIKLENCVDIKTEEMSPEHSGNVEESPLSPVSLVENLTNIKVEPLYFENFEETSEVKDAINNITEKKII